MDEVSYQTHVDEFLAFATSVDHSSNPSGMSANLGRAHRDAYHVWSIDDVWVESLGALFGDFDSLEGTRDFQLMWLHWTLALGQDDTPMTAVARADRHRYYDPLPVGRLDNLWCRLEEPPHHQPRYRVPVRSAVSRRDRHRHRLTGVEHLERAEPDILGWIIKRADVGWFEWHFNVYALKNITPLLMLAELADDTEIVTAAAMALDLTIFDWSLTILGRLCRAPWSHP